MVVIKDFFKTKVFLVLLIAFTVFLVLNETLHIISLRNQILSETTYFTPVIHNYFEVLRFILYVCTIGGFWGFYVTVIKPIDTKVVGLKLASTVYMVNIAVAFVFLITLEVPEVSGNLIFWLILLLVIYSAFVLMYLKKTASFYDLDRDRLPNPIPVIVILSTICLFLVFHIVYEGAGGNYGIDAVLLEPYIHVPFIQVFSMLGIYAIPLAMLIIFHRYVNKRHLSE